MPKQNLEMSEMYKEQLVEVKSRLIDARTIKELKFLQSKIEFLNDQINRVSGRAIKKRAKVRKFRR